MNKPHKHAEVIKAMADGAQAEYQSQFTGKWKAAEGTQSPFSMPIHEWRIKKAPVVRWQWAEVSAVGARLTDYFYTDAEAEKELTNPIKLEYTRMEFDE